MDASRHSSKPSAKHDLREACVSEALRIIEESGIEALSFREVARRLNVSHQAPYKHFASRDAILAEVVARAFSSFASALDAREHSDNPHDDLTAMGLAHLAYATEHPLQYRLMFGTPLPDPEQHPQMLGKAQYCFSILRDCLERLYEGHPQARAFAELDAMFVWSSMHGLVTILETDAVKTLQFTPEKLESVVRHVMNRIGNALGENTGAQPIAPEEI